MVKLYLVADSFHDWCAAYGVFSTREKAKQCVRKVINKGGIGNDEDYDTVFDEFITELDLDQEYINKEIKLL